MTFVYGLKSHFIKMIMESNEFFSVTLIERPFTKKRKSSFGLTKDQNSITQKNCHLRDSIPYMWETMHMPGKKCGEVYLLWLNHFIYKRFIAIFRISVFFRFSNGEEISPEIADSYSLIKFCQ